MEGKIAYLIDLTQYTDEQKKNLVWFALAQMLDGKQCAVCGHLYNSREAVKAHEPLQGYGEDVVGRYCWDAYLAQRSEAER